MNPCHNVNRSVVCRLLWAMLICATTAFAEQRKISYTLEPIIEETGLRFRIELNFNGHESGRTELILPSRSAGQTQLHDGIQKLEILSSNIKVAETSEPWVKVLTHAPDAPIRVRYELVQDRADALQAQRGAGFRPVLQRGYFHWLGSAWVRPGLSEEEQVTFTLDWKNLPPEWAISNTFGVQERIQQFTAPLRSFISSVFVGGDFRLLTVKVKDRPVRIALRGAWSFTDEQFASLVEKIFVLQRGFWNDFNYPDYFVSLLPLEAMANGAANSGTGLDASFATFATPNCRLDDFKYLLAHELFHNWNARRLGKVKEPQELIYWFSEGFTDFYSFRLLLRGGLMTLDEYVASYNEAMRNYYMSPVRNVPNDRVAREFFSNGELSRLTYLRGRLLAENWDALIRANSDGKHSLDDVMRDFFRTGTRAYVNAETIAATVQRYAKEDVSSDIQRLIDNGELLTPNAKLFGDCAQLTMIDVGEFELGFALEPLKKEMKIQGVIPNSAAYRAGLRDGQIVMKRQPIAMGKADREVEIMIKDEGREKTIRYLPVSNNKIKVPQIKLQVTRNAEQKAKCERAF